MNNLRREISLKTSDPRPTPTRIKREKPESKKGNESVETVCVCIRTHVW